MNKTTIMNNVVPHETIRKIQQDVLDKLSMILKQSFGPMGSNTVIKKEDKNDNRRKNYKSNHSSN